MKLTHMKKIAPMTMLLLPLLLLDLIMMIRELAQNGESFLFYLSLSLLAT